MSGRHLRGWGWPPAGRAGGARPGCRPSVYMLGVGLGLGGHTLRNGSPPAAWRPDTPKSTPTPPAWPTHASHPATAAPARRRVGCCPIRRKVTDTQRRGKTDSLDRSPT
eukprot:scaffold418_cov386-Prasinococcus_capsulatus_cf.AAC.16